MKFWSIFGIFVHFMCQLENKLFYWNLPTVMMITFINSKPTKRSWNSKCGWVDEHQGSRSVQNLSGHENKWIMLQWTARFPSTCSYNCFFIYDVCRSERWKVQLSGGHFWALSWMCNLRCLGNRHRLLLFSELLGRILALTKDCGSNIPLTLWIQISRLSPAYIITAAAGESPCS